MHPGSHTPGGRLSITAQPSCPHTLACLSLAKDLASCAALFAGLRWQHGPCALAAGHRIQLVLPPASSLVQRPETASSLRPPRSRLFSPHLHFFLQTLLLSHPAVRVTDLQLKPGWFIPKQKYVYGLLIPTLGLNLDRAMIDKQSVEEVLPLTPTPHCPASAPLPRALCVTATTVHNRRATTQVQGPVGRSLRAVRRPVCPLLAISHSRKAPVDTECGAGHCQDLFPASAMECRASGGMAVPLHKGATARAGFMLLGLSIL